MQSQVPNGLDAQLAHIALEADDLVYATSARGVARALGRGEGIIQVSADLAARQVWLAILPEYAGHNDFKHLLARMGFHVVESHSADTWLEFTIRGLAVSTMTFVLVIGAINHSDIFTPAPELPSLPLLAVIDALALFGAGYSFYHRAFAALAHGIFDTSVLIAIAASAIFIGGAVLAFTLSTGAQSWFAWGALIAASALTAGWFLARGLALWVRIRSEIR